MNKGRGSACIAALALTLFIANVLPVFPAGNRNDAVTDNLNRATSIGGVACTNDILGNRLTKGSTSYGWDALNRMTSLNNGSVTTSHNYRADGIRVLKSNSSGSTVYRYDGQMGMQDVELNSSGVVQKVTNFALGARGVDAMSVTSGGSTSVSYPLYDAHGNMISTLAKNGTGYTYSAVRTFDAWGNIRLGAQTGGSTHGYCANLGHKQDDESGLVYMRARYYEPGSGRFISEDPGRDGNNWFIYCRNSPVVAIDPSGGFSLTETQVGALLGSLFGAGGSIGSQVAKGGWQSISVQQVMGAALLGAITGGGFALAGASMAAFGEGVLAGGGSAALAGATTGIGEALLALSCSASAKFLGWKMLTALTAGLGVGREFPDGVASMTGSSTTAKGAVSASMGRDFQVACLLISMEFD